MRWAALLLLLTVGAAHAAPTVPANAWRWYRTVARNAEYWYGLDAPVALFGAQVQQESAWRAGAQSRYAAGLAQFAPSTAQWIAKLYPRRLGSADVFSPQWAITALVTYDHRLYLSTHHTATDCDRWAMTLSAYNGGAGWLRRDRRLAQRHGADPSRWWGAVSLWTSRSAAARRENRAYPRRILRHWLPVYHRAGWAGPEVCG